MSMMKPFALLCRDHLPKHRRRLAPLTDGSRRVACLAFAAAILPLSAVAQSTVVSARIEAVRTVVARHVSEQERMMRCLSVTNDKWHRIALEDWEAQLGKAAEIIAKAGIAAPDGQALLAPVSIPALLSRPGSPAELLASCKADTTWERRWELFLPYTFSGDLREVLEGKR